MKQDHTFQTYQKRREIINGAMKSFSGLDWLKKKLLPGEINRLLSIK